MRAHSGMPYHSRWRGASTPKRNGGERGAVGGRDGAGRENGSATSKPSITVSTCTPSSAESAKTETQSRVGQFGTRPRVEIRPTVGLMPTMPLKPAGIRSEPPVSVPRTDETTPDATTAAEPELEPPDT